jgi:hypothetical protein
MLGTVVGVRGMMWRCVGVDWGGSTNNVLLLLLILHVCCLFGFVVYIARVLIQSLSISTFGLVVSVTTGSFGG